MTSDFEKYDSSSIIIRSQDILFPRNRLEIENIMSFTMETPLINEEIPPSVEKEINGKEGFNRSSVKIEYNQAVQIASIMRENVKFIYRIRKFEDLSVLLEAFENNQAHPNLLIYKDY